jgi:predicted permease
MTIAAFLGTGNLEAQVDVVTPTGPERLRGALATSNMFDVLGVQALHGRTFSEADEAAGAADIVVLGHSLWTRAFGADPGVVGRAVTLTTGRGRRRGPSVFTVVGVLPATFRFTYPDDVEVWVPRPWTAVAAEPPDAIGYRVVGRLQAGVTLAQAGERMAALHTVIAPPDAQAPAGQRSTTRLEPIHEWVVGDSGRTMTLIVALAALLLLMTCATAANALFIRVHGRRRELALRTAIGATRARLLRQLLVEGVVLAVAATAAGVLLAAGLLPVLTALVPAALARANEASIDAGMLWFGAAAASVVVVLGTLAPAWRGAQVDVASGLKRAALAVTADRTTAFWRRGLVGVQAAVATILLITSALLIVSFWRLVHVPLGFDADDVMTVEMRVLDPALADEAKLRILQQGIVDRVASIPGVRSVALASAVPFRGVDWFRQYDVTPTHAVGGNERQVTPSYFRMLGISLKQGRLLADTDGPGAPLVAVVSESFSRAAFGGDNPIGRVIGGSVPVTIVGVVGDVRYARFDLAPMPAIYLPMAQAPSELMCLLAQTDAAGPQVGAAIRRAIAEVLPALPTMQLSTLAAIVDGTLADREFYTAVAAIFAALALLITVSGLVVVVARTVAERKKELVIRLALGARAAALQRQVVLHGLTPVGIGAAVGVAGVMAGATTLRAFLFAVPAREPAIYAGVCGLLMLAAGLAGWAAARAVSRLTAASVLRDA